MIKNHGVVGRQAVHAYTYFTKLTPHLSSYTALVLPFTRFTNSLRFFKIGHVHDTQNEVIGRELVGPHSDIHSGICRCYGDATSRARKSTPWQTPWYTELDMYKHGKLLDVWNLPKQMEHLVTLSYNPRVTVDSIFSISSVWTVLSNFRLFSDFFISSGLSLANFYRETYYWFFIFFFWSNFSPSLQTFFFAINCPVSV